MMKLTPLYTIITFSCMLFCWSADAALQLHGLFDSNMVLQRDMEVPVWGWADPGITVTVNFSQQSKNTVADQDGKWMVRLDALDVSSDPQTMQVFTSTETNTLDNILVGDVWLCAGQSNMAMSLGSCAPHQDEIPLANYPLIRLFNGTMPFSPEGPQEDIDNDWALCSPTTVVNLSAVAYFFARDLQAEIGVPIGILRTTYAGGPAEAKLSVEALSELDSGAAYIAQMESDPDRFKDTGWWHATDYNANIAPLIPFALRGACWYQGEHNTGNTSIYPDTMHALIADWRTRWNQGDFPFLIVQLPKYGGEPEPRWALMREAQQVISEDDVNSGLVVTIDTGEENQIHPGYKEPVGERLALLARAKVYGENIIYTGPRFEALDISGTNAVVTFSHTGTGLQAIGGALVGFEAAGEDTIFHTAAATISSPTTVSLSAESPIVRVRYAYSGFPNCNLFNLEDLPAAPFNETATQPQPYPGPAEGSYNLDWADEFNGDSVDTNRWDYRTDTRFWSTQQPQNNSVSNGLLNILLKKETVGATEYTSGGLISKSLHRYGYYEARMRVPSGEGWHTSFWMMRNDGSTNDASIELDAFENDSIDPLDYGVNVHRHQPEPHVTYGTKTINTPSLSERFHIVGCEFTSETIKYFFDGELVQTVNATQFTHNDLNVWLTSIAGPLGGTTQVDDTQLPATAEFDYVRFFLPDGEATISIVSPGADGATLINTNLSLNVHMAEVLSTG